MIFCFSGTGNSRFIAEQIGAGIGSEVIDIPKRMLAYKSGEPTAVKEEILGFVFPIYAWGPPQMVLAFIEGLDLSHTQIPYCFAIATCGEDTGKAMDVLRKALGFKGIGLDATYSIPMPNNYVTGSTLDSQERVRTLIEEAKSRLPQIVDEIKTLRSPVSRLHEGSFPRLKTQLINPLFNKHGIRPGGFFVQDTCTGCGICEKVCMTHTIHIEESTTGDKPKWGKNCTFCLACINNCPVEAIQYGKSSEGRGRYVFRG